MDSLKAKSIGGNPKQSSSALLALRSECDQLASHLALFQAKLQQPKVTSSTVTFTLEDYRGLEKLMLVLLDRSTALKSLSIAAHHDHSSKLKQYK